MSYELKAILEYDAARLQIAELTNKISDSMSFFNGQFFVGSCTCESGNCVDDLYSWRKKTKIANDHRCYEDYDHECPEFPDGDEPKLCEAGKITDSLVQERKLARKRFGIAKTRLSRIARDYSNLFVLEVQS